MNSIIQYIEERIAKIEKRYWPMYTQNSEDMNDAIIDELQAVLNKIKEWQNSNSDFVKNCETFMR